MTVQTLLRHLPQFRDGVIALPVAASRQSAAEPARRQPAIATFSRDDVARAAEQARQAALADVETARSECAAAREELARVEDTFAERLTAARAAWCREEGDRLSAALNQAANDLYDRVGGVLAGVLSPFIQETLRKRAIDELTERLSLLIKKGTGGRVFEISGNEDLVAALRERLGEFEGATFSVAPGSDIRIVSDDTVMETQFAAWAALLNQNIG